MQNLTIPWLPIAISTLVFCVGQRLLDHSLRAMPAGRALERPPRFGRWNTPLAHALPQSVAKRQQLQQDLLAAGQYHATALPDFLATRNLASLSAVIAVAGAFALGWADSREWMFLVAGGVLSILTYSVPRVMLSGRASRRQRQIERGIPDALDMIAMTTAAGMPVTAAVGRVADQLRHTHPALAIELRIVARQAKAGSVSQAFREFGARVNLPEVTAWSALMAQSHRLGGRLVNSLNDYANRVRHDRRNRAERAGNTASIKLLLPVITCLSPPIAIMLVGPALLDLRDFINNRDQVSQAVEELQESTAAVPDVAR